MLKHMLTQTGGHPRSGNNPRTPSIPTMEDLHGSPIPEPSGREAMRRNDNRPVSVHGNVIHNQSIYANTVPLAKLANGGLNISSSAPSNVNTSTRLMNGSMNANLNLSNLNSSSNASPGTRTTLMDTSSREHSHHELNTTQISPIQRGIKKSYRMNNTNILSPPANGPQNSTFHQNGGLNITNAAAGGKRLNTSILPANVSKFLLMSKEVGVKEMITSLALLCLVSLLLALLSLVFMLKITPTPKISISDHDLSVVYEVTLAMCSLSLCLNLCCLLVCAIQFLFAIKLVRAPQGKTRTTKYLKNASLTRTCAISGFFVSIPVFLTGIILYTFVHFYDSTSAVVTTAIFIGLGIIFCGAAVVHNVFVWQKEKSKNLKSVQGNHLLNKNDILNKTNKSNIDLPSATIDLSGHNATYISAKGLELSTLV